MTIAEEKQAQRAAGRAARKALDAPQRAAVNAALCRRVLELDAYRAAHTLLLYAAFGGEADLAAVAAEAVRGGLKVEDITPEVISGHLVTAGVPDPDLLIRTSGERRLSNFLLWQLSYSELYFTDVYWPDFDEQEFARAIEDYQQRQRRYGLLTE